MTNLFTTYYKHNGEGARIQSKRHVDAVRQQELDLALAANFSVFDKVYVLAEKFEAPAILPQNVAWKDIDKRQTFRDLLLWASLETSPDDVNIVSNTDIVFPLRSLEVISTHLQPGEMWCLTRYEVTAGGSLEPFKSECSQDSWCWRGHPLSCDCDDQLGIPGCDNRFALAMQKAGYKILNPALSVPTIHLHASRCRTATNDPRNRLPGPYLFFGAHRLGDSPQFRIEERV